VLLAIFFSKLSAKTVFLANPWMMIMRSTGCTTGLVLQIAKAATAVCPVVRGKVLPHAVHYVPLSNSQLDTQVGKDLLLQV
jgi:actin-related protein